MLLCEVPTPPKATKAEASLRSTRVPKQGEVDLLTPAAPVVLWVWVSLSFLSEFPPV